MNKYQYLQLDTSLWPKNPPFPALLDDLKRTDTLCVIRNRLIRSILRPEGYLSHADSFMQRVGLKESYGFYLLRTDPIFVEGETEISLDSEWAWAFTVAMGIKTTDPNSPHYRSTANAQIAHTLRIQRVVSTAVLALERLEQGSFKSEVPHFTVLLYKDVVQYLRMHIAFRPFNQFLWDVANGCVSQRRMIKLYDSLSNQVDIATLNERLIATTAAYRTGRSVSELRHMLEKNGIKALYE